VVVLVGVFAPGSCVRLEAPGEGRVPVDAPGTRFAGMLIPDRIEHHLESTQQGEEPQGKSE